MLSSFSIHLDYVTSAASGHQRGEGRGNERMFHDYRNKKLAEQSMENLASTKECNILYNVRGWCHQVI